VANQKKSKQSSPKKITQQQFAQILGCDPAVVSRLVSSGNLTRGAGFGVWVRELYRYFSETAAGRSTGELDLADERARLAHAQTQKINLEIKIARGKFVSREAIFTEMVTVHAAVRSRVLSIPQRVRSANTRLGGKDFALLEKTVSEILTELSRTELSAELLERVKEIDDEDFARIESVDGAAEPQTTGAEKGNEKSRKTK